MQYTIYFPSVSKDVSRNHYLPIAPLPADFPHTCPSPRPWKYHCICLLLWSPPILLSPIPWIFAAAAVAPEQGPCRLSVWLLQPPLHLGETPYQPLLLMGQTLTNGRQRVGTDWSIHCFSIPPGDGLFSSTRFDVACLQTSHVAR